MFLFKKKSNEILIIMDISRTHFW